MGRHLPAVHGEEGGGNHFYGTPTEEELNGVTTNIHTLHHEYWLRGLVSISSGPVSGSSGSVSGSSGSVSGSSAAGQSTATFLRPGTEGEALFHTNAQTSAAFDYTYATNSYLTSLTGYDKKYNDWYTKEHTYADYKPLTANTPYIVSFPGTRYYEFNLTSQTITFSNNDGTLVPVTTATTTTVDDYNHVGTFLHVADATYGMNNTGTGFESDKNTVLPFRTYMATIPNSADSYALQYVSRILIGNIEAETPEALGSEEEQEDPDEGISGSHLRIRPDGNRIIIDSTYPTTLMVHTIGGSLVRILDVRPGINTYSGFPSGILIVGQKKVRIM